jgi:error-prone DNA polymerase
MQQAYLKAYYPAIFLASVLRNGGGYYHPQVYVFEAERLGVPVLGPCVFQSDAGDDVVTYRGRPAIRLGLGRLRGLSLAAVRRIVAARQHGAFTGLEDFLARTGLGPEETETLIDVGAFDALDGSAGGVGAGRRRRTWELHALAGRTRAATAGTPLLFPAASLADVLAALPPLPPYAPAEILHAEMFYLGLPLTYHPIELAAAELAAAGRRWLPGDDLARHVGRRARMLGWLMSAKRITTRGRGRPMGFLTFYDGGTDLFEAVLFPHRYAAYASSLQGCGPYELEGTVEADAGAVYLNLRTLAPYRSDLFDFSTPTPWARSEEDASYY